MTVDVDDAAVRITAALVAHSPLCLSCLATAAGVDQDAVHAAVLRIRGYIRIAEETGPCGACGRRRCGVVT